MPEARSCHTLLVRRAAHCRLADPAPVFPGFKAPIQIKDAEALVRFQTVEVEN
jgi:hypothetical protein